MVSTTGSFGPTACHPQWWARRSPRLRLGHADRRQPAQGDQSGDRAVVQRRHSSSSSCCSAVTSSTPRSRASSGADDVERWRTDLGAADDHGDFLATFTAFVVVGRKR
jgi:hypothetical protein